MGLLRCRLDPGQLPRVYFVFTESIYASVSLLSVRGIFRPTMTTDLPLPPPPPPPPTRCLCSCPITPLYLVRLLCCLLMSNTGTIRALIVKPNRSSGPRASWRLSRRELRLRACVTQLEHLRGIVAKHISSATELIEPPTVWKRSKIRGRRRAYYSC